MTLNELLLLLKSAGSVEDIDAHRQEIADIIPKVEIMFDYDQQNDAHQYDLWMHSLHTVINLPRNLDDDMLYLAALLHDIGKPDSRCRGKREDDTDMHYYGHPEKSLEIVKNEVIPELARQGYSLDTEDEKRLLYYVQYHDDHVSVKLKHVRRHLKMVDFTTFRFLMQLQVADAKAHVRIPIIAQRIDTCERLADKEGEELYGQIK